MTHGQVSTIVEFRSVGYKMENCQLVVTVPVDPGAAIKLGTGQNLVDIWRVATNTTSWLIDPKSLTWDTRPTRVSKIGSFTIMPGTNYTHSFSCLSDSLHVFEFSTGDEDVHVQWSQDHNNPDPGTPLTCSNLGSWTELFGISGDDVPARIDRVKDSLMNQ